MTIPRALLTTLALSLTVSPSTGMAAAPTPPTPPTRAFTVTGPVTNTHFTASAAVLLAGTTLKVGTVDASGTVTVTLPATPPASVPWRSFSQLLTAWQTAKCDTSGLTVEDSQFRSTDAFDVTGEGGVRLQLYPMTVTSGPDGTRTTVVSQFYYALGPGRLSGTLVCGGVPRTFDLTLQPGWTIARRFDTTDASRRVVQARIGDAVTAEAYDGPWAAFRVP